MVKHHNLNLATASAEDLKSMEVATHDPDLVTAASLSRIWRHFTTDDVNVGIAIVSADRGDRAFKRDESGRLVLDEKENAKLNEKMRAKLRSVIKKFGSGGFIATKGGYKEEGVGLVYETSYVIPGVTREEAVKLARVLGEGSELNSIKNAEEKVKKGGSSLANDFRQDSILWGNNEAGAFLVWPNGKLEKIGSTMKMNNVQDLFTEWKSRRVTFACSCESIEYIPNSPSDYREWRRELAESSVQTAFS